ncbi:MAG TPA: S46 family peptidase, partial [Candidatus Aminicenantes bacterium]|nr:S46 family peptidase [Candidatus Aminicenantes bacterium]
MSKTPRGMIIACILAAAVLLPADEGMWLPHQMKDLQLKSQGLRMDPDDLYKTDGTGLMSAVVNLGGGTGEFVSAEGLILTNHHVAFGAIQRAASKEKDYIREGFLARGRQEEIPAKGYTADVLLGYEDVTA